MIAHLGHARARAVDGVALVDGASVRVVASVGRELAHAVHAHILSALEEIVADNRRRHTLVGCRVTNVRRARVAVIAHPGRRAALAVREAHGVEAGRSRTLVANISM